jgi:hypothetical protein
VGERLQREFQREAQRRTAKSRDLLFAEGSTDTDRTVAKGVQHDPAPQLAWIPPTSSGGNHALASAGRKSEIISGNAIGGRSITGSNDDLSLSKAIELGADQYLVKPMSLSAIQAHVTALLRMKQVGRYSDKPSRVIKTLYGSVDLDARLTTKHGVSESLSNTEWFLLEAIAEGRGRVVTMSTLSQAVWGRPDVGVATLKSTINRLRTKIGDDDKNNPIIINHQSVGFSIDKL